jgi:hypothetical protein
MIYHAREAPPPEADPPPSGNLRTSVRRFVDELERKPGESTKLAVLSRRFQINMRRIYDIVNVFSAVGCCVKSHFEDIVWNGVLRVRTHLRELGDARGIDSPNCTLADLFPATGSVGMARLTTDYLLLYRALGTSHLDLRMVATLLSRGTARFRSTLCKLYQISFILCAAGVTSRTTLICHVALLDKCIDFAIVPTEHAVADPTDYRTLLNRRKDQDFVHKRRKEFCQLWSATAKGSHMNAHPQGVSF